MRHWSQIDAWCLSAPSIILRRNHMPSFAQQVSVHIENGGVPKSLVSRAWFSLVSMMVFINTEHSDDESNTTGHHRPRNMRPRCPWCSFRSPKSQPRIESVRFATEHLPVNFGGDALSFVMQCTWNVKLRSLVSFFIALTSAGQPMGCFGHGSQFFIALRSAGSPMVKFHEAHHQICQNETAVNAKRSKVA